MRLNAYDAWYRLPALHVIELWLQGDLIREDTEADRYRFLALQMEYHAVISGNVKASGIRKLTKPLYDFAKRITQQAVPDTGSPRAKIAATKDSARKRFFGLDKDDNA